VQNIVYCLQCFIAGKNQFQFPFLYSSSFHLSDGEASLSLWFFFSWKFHLLALAQLVQCIFRKPKECKDRHKILMDKGAGDGADSAEDSGSSQSYPSTLPGIPKVRLLMLCCFLTET